MVRFRWLNSFRLEETSNKRKPAEEWDSYLDAWSNNVPQGANAISPQQLWLDRIETQWVSVQKLWLSYLLSSSSPNVKSPAVPRMTIMESIKKW